MEFWGHQWAGPATQWPSAFTASTARAGRCLAYGCLFHCHQLLQPLQLPQSLLLVPQMHLTDKFHSLDLAWGLG